MSRLLLAVLLAASGGAALAPPVIPTRRARMRRFSLEVLYCGPDPWTDCVQRCQGKVLVPSLNQSKRRILSWALLGILLIAAGSAYYAYHVYYLPGELRVAAAKGNLQEVERLLRAGVNVNQPLGLPSNSVLNRAVEGGNPEVVRTVLRAGADPNARGETGMTPLMVAAFFGNRAIIEVLLENAANKDLVEDRRKDTALLIAVRRGNSDAVKALLSAKSNPNQGSEWGAAPLCEARSRGLSDIERALIEAGAKCSPLEPRTK